MTAAPYTAEVFRCFTAMLLLAAAVGKLRTLAEFRQNLTESFGASVHAARVLAPAIAAGELLLACAIAAGHAMPGSGGIAYAAMAGALALFALFTALVARKYIEEGIVRCSCFGEAGRSVSPFDLLRNVLVMACIAFYLAYAGGPPALVPEAWFLAAGLAAFLTVLAVEFHEIAMLLVHSGEGWA